MSLPPAAPALAVPLPNSYWILPGRLLAGEYPGDRRPSRAEEKLNLLVDAGIRTFVDLTESHELTPYEAWLESEADARGLAVRYQRFPIEDLNVPTVSRMRDILAEITRAVEAAAPVYVHCWGGIGRTGTVVGCWLVERGHTGVSALEHLDELGMRSEKKRRPSPEMPEQLEFVRTWGTGRRRMSGKLGA